MSKQREQEQKQEEIQEEVVQAEEAGTAEEWREKYLRTLAELDNFRKRVERDHAQMRKYAGEPLMRGLLPILDALELAAGADGGEEQIREGVCLVVNDALRIMGEMGLEPIEAIDQPFDPRLHEAVGVFPDPDREPGIVIREERRGYRIHDRVLRPSRVHITTAPPEPAEQPKE